MIVDQRSRHPASGQGLEQLNGRDAKRDDLKGDVDQDTKCRDGRNRPTLDAIDVDTPKCPMGLSILCLRLVVMEVIFDISTPHKFEPTWPLSARGR